MRRRVVGFVGIAGSAGMLLACSGSGGGATSPAGPGAPPTTTAPAPLAAPTPTPTPVPTPTPQVPPVAKVTIKIEFIDCPATGEVIQGGPYNWTSVGCRIHMDLNAKDRYNKPVQGKGDPEWHVNDPSLVYVREDRTYTPTLVAQEAGKLLIQGEQDGVKSNTVQIWLY